jgi:hypothetical protein
MKKTLDLGSFGVMVRSADGSEKALTIHPVAILHGHGPWQPLHDAQNHFESLIANPFMAFPDLNQVSHSPTYRKIWVVRSWTTSPQPWQDWNQAGLLNT